jgi:D-lactate dehydrogenase
MNIDLTRKKVWDNARFYAEDFAMKQQSTEECYSSGKPCEMSMSETTGKNYRSVFYLLDEVSEKK